MIEKPEKQINIEGSQKEEVREVGEEFIEKDRRNRLLKDIKKAEKEIKFWEKEIRGEEDPLYSVIADECRKIASSYDRMGDNENAVKSLDKAVECYKRGGDNAIARVLTEEVDDRKLLLKVEEEAKEKRKETIEEEIKKLEEEVEIEKMFPTLLDDDWDKGYFDSTIKTTLKHPEYFKYLLFPEVKKIVGWIEEDINLLKDEDEIKWRRRRLEEIKKEYLGKLRLLKKVREEKKGRGE